MRGQIYVSTQYQLCRHWMGLHLWRLRYVHYTVRNALNQAFILLLRSIIIIIIIIITSRKRTQVSEAFVSEKYH